MHSIPRGNGDKWGTPPYAVIPSAPPLSPFETVREYGEPVAMRLRTTMAGTQ